MMVQAEIGVMEEGAESSGVQEAEEAGERPPFRASEQNWPSSQL